MNDRLFQTNEDFLVPRPAILRLSLDLGIVHKRVMHETTMIGIHGIHPQLPTAFLDLPFVETKNLKYDSAAFKEAHATPAGA